MFGNQLFSSIKSNNIIDCKQKICSITSHACKMQRKEFPGIFAVASLHMRANLALYHYPNMSLRIRHEHGDLCKHIGIYSSTDLESRYLILISCKLPTLK